MLLIPDSIQALLEWSKRKENNVHIKNMDIVTKKLTALHQQKAQHIHIIADFDNTLTQYWDSGKRSLSSHGVLENSVFLPSSVKGKLLDLYNKYYPIEINHDLPKEVRIKSMVEWWSQAHQIFIDSGLSRSVLKEAVKKARILFRPLLKEFISLVTGKGIPLLIFSAGLGDIIYELLTLEPGYWTSDMAIVSNHMIFDDNNVLTGFKDPLIHVFNKNEAGLPESLHAEKVAHRDNVILLGDSLGDLKMADGIRHEVKLTIGFLNHDVDTLLAPYEDAFDIVLLNDTSLEFVILMIAAI
jgi:cytosolic 5'-nucleotidase 3